MTGWNTERTADTDVSCAGVCPVFHPVMKNPGLPHGSLPFSSRTITGSLHLVQRYPYFLSPYYVSCCDNYKS